jgi:hypothetical protein
VAIATQQTDIWYRHFEHLIGLHTHRKMIHGAYNVLLNVWW